MTTTQDDGGPAFPQPDLSGYEIGPCDRMGGMSLRDWFAGQALIGIGTWMPGLSHDDLTRDGALKERAQWAYAQADAMLAARKEPSR